MAVLPAAATVFIAVHVLLVQLHGMSVPTRYDEKSVKRMKFFPNFFLRDLIGWILAIGVLAALAALFPWELGEKADPFAPAPAGNTGGNTGNTGNTGTGGNNPPANP